mgnify:CR=1 FL=1
MKIKIPEFTGAKTLVVGDVMLDRYWQGDVGRISPEAPVPVVHVKEVEEYPGVALVFPMRSLGTFIPESVEINIIL